MKTHQGEFEIKENTSPIICLVDVLLMCELLFNVKLQITGSVRSPAEGVEARGEIHAVQLY